MDKKSFQWRQSNGSKKRKTSSAFNFFRKPSNERTAPLSDQRPSRIESQYDSLKSNNGELAKALEKSHLREAGLKEEISKLQEANIDLITKLQIFKEEQESHEFDSVRSKRIVMRKLIDAVDLMAKATMSNEPLHQSTFMDVDQNSHKRKSFCDTDESIQSDPKHTRESHVTVRDSCSSAMEMDSSQDSILQRIRRGILDEEIREESHFETPMQEPSHNATPNTCSSTGTSAQSHQPGGSQIDLQDYCLNTPSLEMSSLSNRGLAHGIEGGAIDCGMTTMGEKHATGGNRTFSTTSNAGIEEPFEIVGRHQVSPWEEMEERYDDTQIEIIGDSTNRRRTFEVLDESECKVIGNEVTELPKKQRAVSRLSNTNDTGNIKEVPKKLALGMDDTVPQNEEKLSKKERRSLKRKQRKTKRSQRTGNEVVRGKYNMRSTVTISDDDDDDDKENINPSEKRHKMMQIIRNPVVRCSPLKEVMNRIFSPMHARSPLAVRNSRIKRKVSYAEPSLAKKLRRGDPMTDSTLYSSPRLVGKKRTKTKQKRHPLVTIGGTIDEEK